MTQNIVEILGLNEKQEKEYEIVYNNVIEFMAQTRIAGFDTCIRLESTPPTIRIHCVFGRENDKPELLRFKKLTDAQFEKRKKNFNN